MPYSEEHKQRTREKILKSALELFSRHGFDAVSIDDLMADAGLTRGAFYAHFRSKSEVYAEAITSAVSLRRLSEWQDKGEGQGHWLKELLLGYLSHEHVAMEVSPCPLAFFSTDVANRDEAVRHAYTSVYAGLNRMLTRILGHETSEGDEAIADHVLAATAMMIGGISIARALDDPQLADRLLNTCREHSEALLATGGRSRKGRRTATAS